MFAAARLVHFRVHPVAFHPREIIGRFEEPVRPAVLDHVRDAGELSACREPAGCGIHHIHVVGLEPVIDALRDLFTLTFRLLYRALELFIARMELEDEDQVPVRPQGFERGEEFELVQQLLQVRGGARRSG
jgi:hypothetical protein